jgi:hypothetical protein
VVAAREWLHARHALVLDPAAGDIKMANPFSAVPTACFIEGRRGQLCRFPRLS